MGAGDPTIRYAKARLEKSRPSATGCGKGRAAKVATVADGDEDND